LNMLIAIISAAYDEAAEEAKCSKDVDLTHVRCARAPTFLGFSLIPPPPLPTPTSPISLTSFARKCTKWRKISCRLV
jgi:hypothetical protein